MHRIKKLIRVSNHKRSKRTKLNSFTSKIFNSCATVVLVLVVAAVLVAVGVALGLTWCHVVESGSDAVLTTPSGVSW